MAPASSITGRGRQGGRGPGARARSSRRPRRCSRRAGRAAPRRPCGAFAVYRDRSPRARKVSGWPKWCKLAQTCLWEYSYKRLRLAQLLGQLGRFFSLRTRVTLGFDTRRSQPTASWNVSWSGSWPEARFDTWEGRPAAPHRGRARRRPGVGRRARRVSGWPKRCKLARASLKG